MHKLEQFIRKAAHGTHLLPLSHEGIRPGSIIDARWGSSLRNRIRKLFNRRKVLHELGIHKGYGWDLLGLNEQAFTTVFEQGSLLTGTLHDQFVFSGSLDFLPYGIDLGLAFDEVITAQIVVSDVRVMLFERSFAGHDLRRRLRQLKEDDDPDYANVDDCFLVVECFFLDGLRWQFSGAELRKLHAALDRQEVDIAEYSGVEWANKAQTELVVSGTSKAPLAVRGLKI